MVRCVVYTVSMSKKGGENGGREDFVPLIGSFEGQAERSAVTITIYSFAQLSDYKLDYNKVLKLPVVRSDEYGTCQR